MASRRQTPRKKKKNNTGAIIFISLLLVLVTAGIALTGYLLFHGKTYEDVKEGTAFTDEPALVTTAEESEEAEPEVPEIPEEERYYFDNGQMYRGDLILVNADHAFNFDANGDPWNDVMNIREAGIIKCAMASDELELSVDIMKSLEIMIEDCDEAIGSYDTGLSSAYRSYEYQQKVYDEIKEEYGESYADTYVATPGYSEHHTGIAFDMGIYRSDGYVGTFSESNNAVWVDENCQSYGFVRRYKEDKASITGISNEAWHFRWVGVPHATYMNEHDLCLEEYIEELREHTIDNPIRVKCNTGTYIIWYTQDSYIREPENAFTVSGNNIDGYIITETASA